jgi:CheY-like chemotaxis protein
VAERTAELHSLNEELQQASKAKDHFLAALSHELRTPMTPVLMCAASLERETALQPEFREQLGMMRRNVELEARLIDDLLDLTRISRGKLELQLAPTDVHSLLAHTEQIVRSEARGKGVNIRFVLNAGQHVVKGDAARLHQVFWNMVKNAIKFTPSGGQITVCTTNVSGCVCVEVRDDGIGIDPDILPSVFGAFVQGDAETGHTARGLGLGMSISKTIVEMHGGTSRADSAGVGEGATFTVALETVSAPETGSVSVPAIPPPGGPGYRLLVVEDHQPTLDVLARLLRKQGHEVVTASTVEAALNSAAQNQFDLVISDIGLPDGNGVDLMVQLTRDYGLRGIALSGYGMDADFARTKDAGFVAHLIKPVDFERLSRVLEQAARAA